MSERREFRLGIASHLLGRVATDAVSELETARAKEAIAYSLERFKLVEVIAVKLRGGGENDRRFSILRDDRLRKVKD